MFGNFIPDNVNAGGSGVLIRKILFRSLTKDATMLFKIRSGESAVVVINVHFETGLNFRTFEKGYDSLSPIGLAIPKAWESLWVINICDPEEGRFSVMNQTYTEGDPGRIALFRIIFTYALEIAQPSFTRKNTAADGTLRIFPELTERYRCAHG